MDIFSPVTINSSSVKLASSNPKKKSGRKKFQETRHPVYRGVRQRKSGKWVCEVREPSKQARIWLGTFPTARMAALAHDVATLALRGSAACLNFADSPWKLAVPRSKDVKDIQRAAAEAAREFRAEQVEEIVVSDYYIDEEEVFGMPRLLDNMAQGMLLPPLDHHMVDEFIVDYVELDADLSLWSY